MAFLTDPNNPNMAGVKDKAGKVHWVNKDDAYGVEWAKSQGGTSLPPIVGGTSNPLGDVNPNPAGNRIEVTPKTGAVLPFVNPNQAQVDLMTTQIEALPPGSAEWAKLQSGLLKFRKSTGNVPEWATTPGSLPPQTIQLGQQTDADEGGDIEDLSTLDDAQIQARIEALGAGPDLGPDEQAQIQTLQDEQARRFKQKQQKPLADLYAPGKEGEERIIGGRPHRFVGGKWSPVETSGSTLPPTTTGEQGETTGKGPDDPSGYVDKDGKPISNSVLQGMDIEWALKNGHIRLAGKEGGGPVGKIEGWIDKLPDFIRNILMPGSGKKPDLSTLTDAQLKAGLDALKGKENDPAAQPAIQALQDELTKRSQTTALTDAETMVKTLGLDAYGVTADEFAKFTPDQFFSLYESKDTKMTEVQLKGLLENWQKLNPGQKVPIPADKNSKAYQLYQRMKTLGKADALFAAEAVAGTAGVATPEELAAYTAELKASAQLPKTADEAYAWLAKPLQPPPGLTETAEGWLDAEGNSPTGASLQALNQYLARANTQEQDREAAYRLIAQRDGQQAADDARQKDFENDQKLQEQRDKAAEQRATSADDRAIAAGIAAEERLESRTISAEERAKLTKIAQEGRDAATRIAEEGRGEARDIAAENRAIAAGIAAEERLENRAISAESRAEAARIATEGRAAAARIAARASGGARADVTITAQYRTTLKGFNKVPTTLTEAKDWLSQTLSQPPGVMFDETTRQWVDEGGMLLTGDRLQAVKEYEFQASQYGENRKKADGIIKSYADLDNVTRARDEADTALRKALGTKDIMEQVELTYLKEKADLAFKEAQAKHQKVLTFVELTNNPAMAARLKALGLLDQFNQDTGMNIKVPDKLPKDKLFSMIPSLGDWGRMNPQQQLDALEMLSAQTGWMPEELAALMSETTGAPGGGGRGGVGVSESTVGRSR